MHRSKALVLTSIIKHLWQLPRPSKRRTQSICHTVTILFLNFSLTPRAQRKKNFGYKFDIWRLLSNVRKTLPQSRIPPRPPPRSVPPKRTFWALFWFAYFLHVTWFPLPCCKLLLLLLGLGRSPKNWVLDTNIYCVERSGFSESLFALRLGFHYLMHLFSDSGFALHTTTLC